MNVLKTYFMLLVTDMDRAAAFYTRALHLKERFRSPEWSELDSGGATIALHAGKKAHVSTETGLGFEVDDVNAACVRVKEAGGTIVSAPKQQEHVDLRLAVVADTEGNTFTLAQTG
jgi:predicted enzyme related to lactoylglutathione lyase